MWNDGYSKEQPWLNYFNSYERMHCCFGDDDGGDDDSGAADDEAANTSAGGTASAAGSAAESSDSYDDAMGPGFDSTGAGDEAANTSDGGTASSAQSAAESEASYDAAMDAGPGWGEPDGFDDRDATYNAQTNNFDFAVDTKSDNFLEDVATIGFDNFENPSDLDLATMNEMYNNPDAYGMGYNDFVDMGYFDKAEAADYAQSKAEAAALEASYKDKGKDVSISVAKDGTYSYTGKDAFSVGYSEMGKGAELLGRNFGIGSVVDGLNRAFGTTEEEVASSYGQGDPGANFSDFQSTSSQNGDDTFGEDETDEGVDDTDTDTDTETSTTESEEEEEEAPETAMEAYFRKLGIASPALTVPSTSPSSFQGYPSYLPPIGPAANAAYRRKLALGTPRYQEPSGTNPSIATYAAAYGIPYTEAAKKFAPPSVPAMGGGGLRSLMEYK